MLRERPVEADVDPRFEVLLEPVANQLLDGVVDHWLQQTLEAPTRASPCAAARLP